jgi:hypothetical protein
MASQQLEIAPQKELRQVRQMLDAFKDIFQMLGANSDELRKAMSHLPGPGCCLPPPVPRMEGSIGVQIPLPGKTMSPETFQKAPHINTEADWPAYANAIDSRITGSQANREAIHCNGKNIWTTPGNVEDRAAVGWVMQQNENLKYDSDKKMFYQTFPDGSTRDVASLDEIKNVIQQNGGANQNNGKAFQAVGSFINGRVNSLPAKVEPGGVFEANLPFAIKGSHSSHWLLEGKNEILGCHSKKGSMDLFAAGGFQLRTNPATLNSYPKVPGVNTESDWAAYSQALDSRMVGSEANRKAIHLDGENIWTAQGGNLDERAAVGWALQQNENLKYDADKKSFFTTSSDGSRRDVASLEDVTKVIQQNGGANQNNTKAMQAVGSFLDSAVKNSAQNSPELPKYGTLAFMALIRADISEALV